MEELVVVAKTQFNDAEINSVNSRELHKFLESKQQYADWIKSRLDDLGAIENQDFRIHKFMNPKIENNNKWQTDYIVTLDIAKHIAMMERNEKGKQARQYFIEVEKTYLSNHNVPQLSPIEQALAHMKIMEQQIAEEKQRKAQVERLLETASTLIGNMGAEVEGYDIGLQELCAILTSRASDVIIGRTSLYIILRSMDLVVKDGTKPTNYGSRTYLDYKLSEHGYSVRVQKDRLGKLTTAIVKFLLNNPDINSSINYPFHPELR